MAQELMLSPRVSQWVVQSLCRLIASFAVLQGVSVIVGGATRWQGDAFKYALLLPGAPPSWGVFILVFGILALYGSLRSRYHPVIVGMLGIASWCIFFALGISLAAIHRPTASMTGIPTYFTLGFVCVLVGFAYKESRSLRR